MNLIDLPINFLFLFRLTPPISFAVHELHELSKINNNNNNNVILQIILCHSVVSFQHFI